MKYNKTGYWFNRIPAVRDPKKKGKYRVAQCWAICAFSLEEVMLCDFYQK